MTTTFESAPRLFFTSESVTEGHPDKMCDQVSDAILDAILEQDPTSRVACETWTTTGVISVIGEITTAAHVDYNGIIRQVVKDIGYTNAAYGIDGETCAVHVSLGKQSPDIAQGVDSSKEERLGQAVDDLNTGAGDQGMMFGFACTETPELMPLPVSLAHRLTRRLAQVRKDGLLPYLRPDGKSQVTVEYHHGRPVRVDTIVIAAQHDPDVASEQIDRDIREHVIDAVIPSQYLDDNTRYHINATGRFVVGGPKGDAGLTGRKIIADTYGGMARHGGGAFSGKDPTKVDRSAAYMARYVAKNIVAAGLAERCEIQISYAIGVARPTSVNIETFGTNTIDNDTILEIIEQSFDLRPAAIIRDLGLRRPIFRQTAAYGHFGRDDLDLPWEQTDRASSLKAAAGAIPVRA